MPRPQISYKKQQEGLERIAIRNLYAADVRKAAEILRKVVENSNDPEVKAAAEHLKAVMKAESDYLKHEETMRQQRKAMKRDKNYT